MKPWGKSGGIRHLIPAAPVGSPELDFGGLVCYNTTLSHMFWLAP